VTIGVIMSAVVNGVLQIGCVSLAAALALSGSGRLASGPGPAAQPPTASYNDGICVQGHDFALSRPTVAATKTQGWALTAARGSLAGVPDGASWATYYAEMSSSFPDNSLRKPLVNRPVWVVEIGGFSRPYGGKPTRAGDPQPTQPYLHHLVDVWDDTTGVELFDVSCP
jgi:hypothetical protein